MFCRKSLLGWLGLFIFLLSSCRIGLGAAIDTKSPEISVNYPIADSVIRDAFYLSGTWNDDGEILGVNLQMKHPDDTGEIYTYICSFENDGTWSCVINPLDSEHPIPDGVYELIISITDTYYHESSCSTLFTIDNTPPVVVLQRPSSKVGDSASDYDSYGQTFSLEGQAADDNDVELIQVDFYSDEACTNLIHTVKKENVPSTILLDVASFEEGVQNDYSLIYGSTSKNGPKNIYCKITAYDGSKRYPKDGSGQQSTDLLGNAAECYYLYDLVSSEIFSKYKYKITDVYHMFCGSYVGEDSNRSAENSKTIVDLLSKNAVSHGVFTLNPANNPYFTVTGRENLKKDGTDFTAPEYFITNDSDIVVEVSPGLDGIPLDVDSIKVFFIECDDNAAILPDAQKLYPLTSKTRSGNSYKYVTSVDSSCGIIIGSNYIIGVEGTDNQKNPIVETGSGYGFFLAANGSAPILTITNPGVGKTYLKKGEELLTSGFIYFAEDLPELEIKCNGTVLKSCTKIEDYTVDPAVPNKYSFSYNISTSVFDQTKSDYYEIEFVASKGNLISSKIKEVEYDVFGPVITFDSISPIAQNYYDIPANENRLLALVESETPDKNLYLNKKFSFKVSLEDDDKVDPDSAKYAIYAGKVTDESALSGLTPITSGSIDPTSKNAISVDSSSWTSGEITIFIEASDKVGNRSVYFENGYHIEQKTDKPVMIPADTLDFDITDGTVVKTASKNQFERSQKFNIRCIDDDGIKTIKVFSGANPGNLTEDKAGSKDYSTSTPKEINFEYSLNLEPEVYYFKIITEDKFGISREVIFAVNIKATASNPKIISIVKTSSSANSTDYINMSGSFTNTITIEGGTPPYKLYRSTKEDLDLKKIGLDDEYMNSLMSSTPPVLWKVLPGSEIRNNPVSDTDIRPSSDVTFYYIARDSSDNGGVVSNIWSVECKVDGKNPEVQISSPKGKTGINAISDGVFAFNGTVSDEGSGAYELYYTFAKKGYTPVDGDWKVDKVSNGIWSLNKTILAGTSTNSIVKDGNLSEGSWTLYVKAKDAVENVSTIATEVFDIDLGAPVLTLNNPSAEGKKETFTLSGTAKDGNGLETIVVTTDKSSTYYQSVNLPTNGDDNWTTDIEIYGDKTSLPAGANPLPDGVNTLTITATDKMGKTAVVTKTVTVDTIAPETLTITSPKAKPNARVIEDNVFSFTGNASDSVSGVAKIYYAFTKEATHPDISNYIEEAATNGIWSFDKNINAGSSAQVTGNLYEGVWYLWILAEDNAQNKTVTPVSVEFDVDLSVPEICDTSTIGEYVNTDFTFTGKASDVNGIQQIQISDGTFSKDVDLTNDYDETTGEWSVKIEVGSGTGKLSEGKHNLKLLVKDTMGKSTYINRAVEVDTVNPIVDTSKIRTPNSNDFDSENVEFKGTASDIGGSGVGTVQILFADNESYSSGNKTEWFNASGDTSWNFVVNTKDSSVSSVFNSEGIKYIFVKATDNAGNVSDEQHASFLYDKAVPVLSDLSYSFGGSDVPASDGSNIVLGKDSFTIKGKFADSCSPVEILVTQNGVSVTPAYTAGQKAGVWTLPVENLSDGSYKFNFTAKDSTGRLSEVQSLIFRIDTTAPTVDSIVPPTEVETESSVFTFKGTASDNSGGTGVEKIYIGFAERASGATDWTGFKEAFGTTNWSCPIDTSDNPSVWASEGNKTIYVYAVDAVGNISTVKTEVFVYDTAKPVVSAIVDGVSPDVKDPNKYLVGSLFTLSGTSSDANGISFVSVTESKDGGTPENVTITGTTDWSSNQLPLAINRNDGNPKSGTYTYVIFAQDTVSKKSSEFTITVSIDVDAPVITILNPQIPDATGVVPASGDKSLSGPDYTFRGTINDVGTSGLKAYKYQILENTDPAPTDKNDSKWITELVNTNGSWNLYRNLGNGKSPSVPDANTIYEGHYKLYMFAQDNAGNQSDIVWTEFFVDQGAPVIEGVSYQIGSNTPVLMTKDKVDYLNTTENNVTLIGTATDSYKVKEVKINNETIIINADSSWSKIVTLTTNSNIICQITAQDDAGRTTTEKYTLFCDKISPTIEITSPDNDISGNDSLNGSNYTFRFAANDEGSGVKEYKYLFTDTPMTPAQIISAATDVNAESNGWKRQTGDNSKETFLFENGKTPASSAPNTIYEGMHYIHMYGIDNSGNESTLTRTYWVDKAAPTLTETNVPISGVTLGAGGKLTLSGTVSDVNKIVSLIIKDNVTSNEWAVTLFDDCDDTENPTPWTKEIELGSGTDKLIDNEHSLTIIAKDGADKETQLIRSVIVDTKAPVATGITVTTTPDYEDSNSNNWFKNSTVGIKVTGVQDSAEGTTSYKTGIATVQYTTDTGANPSWIPLQKGTETSGVADWSASVYCPNQGLNTIKIQIVDNAGNIKSDLSKSVYIDTERPALPLSTEYKIDGSEGVTGSKLINGRNTVKVNITSTDGIKEGLDVSSTSGLKQIVYKGVSDYTYTCTNAGPYEFDIPVANLKTGQVKFVIFDNVGNTIDWTPFSFIKDETAPSVKIISPSDADSIKTGIQVNGSFTLEGSAKDSGGAELESIDLCYYENSTNGWQHLAHLNGESTWSYNIDTDLLTDGSAVTICAIVTDTAGNRNLDTKSGSNVTDNTALVSGSTENRVPTIIPDEITNDETNGKINKISIVVDQDSDRPVIKFSTIDLNGDINGIIWLKNQTKIVGSITDDDGIVNSSFKISLTDSSTESDWKSIDVDGNSWSYNVADFFTGTDEEKEKAANKLINLYFKVQDVKGREFKSKTINSTCNETDYSTVKLQSGTTNVVTKGILATDKTKIATSTILPLTIDTLPPTIEIEGGKVNISDDFNSSVSSLKFGGTKTAFYLKLKAGDGQNQLKETNGIVGTATFNLSEEKIIVPATVTPEENDEYILTYELTESQIIKIKNEEYNDVVEVKVVAEDKAGNKSNQTASINADFKKPIVTLSSPDNSQSLSGSVMVYGSIDSTATMYYSLSLDDTTTPGNDEKNKGSAITSWKDDNGIQHANTINFEPYYKPIVGNSFQWYIYFDGKPSEEEKTHDSLFKDYLTSYGITTIDEINNKNFKDIVTFYLWIKATDESGNQSIEKYRLYVDPQGDAPKLSIDYPKDDGTVLGGNVTLRGTATDTIGSNIGIKNVWIQIISANNNGYESSNTNQLNITKGGLTFSDKVTQINDAYSHTYTIEDFKPKGKDVKQWIEKGYSVYTNIGNNEPTLVETAPADAASAENYYIMATVSGSTWNLSINRTHEFDPGQGKLNLVVYRAYAQDNDNNVSRYQQQFAVFDSDTPIFSNIYLRQYSNNDEGSGTVIASRPYETDMWVKGKWWIYGSVQDTQGIESLKINDEVQPGITGGEGVEEIFNFPLSTDTGVGSYSIKIEAEDKASSRHTGFFDGTVNFDNTKPELVTSGTTYKINNSIQNSNGFYMFSSQVRENAINSKPQSGFDYLAFWFERNNAGKHVIYDVMRKQTNREIAWTDVTESEGLMWKTKTVTRSDTSLGVITLSAEDPNIHVGGLCKIGGSVYKISSVSGSVIGISGQPELPAGYSQINKTQTAYFAMANVVDNSIESAIGDKSFVDGRYGYYSTISNDDGDYMVESVQKSGTNWTWEANINSQNIPDGSIILHYVAFDKAGNYEVGSVDANVANNAPRLASLKVWTDFDEDGTEDEGESETKFCLRKTRTIGGSGKYVATDVTSKLIVSGNDKDYDSDVSGTSFMSITAATKFIPEIIGGNGDLYYSRKIGTAANVKNVSSNYGTASFGKGHDDGIDEEVDNLGYKILDEEGSDYVQGHIGYLQNPTDTQESLYVLEVTNSDLENLDNGLTWFNYTIYDSTEGCSTWDSTATGTTGRLTAEFHVALNVLYKDEVAPSVNFIPLYWKSSTENSVYMDVNENKYGHVELKSDLGSTSLGSTYGTNDDKVSGIVVFRGTAFDNKKLKQLNWKLMAENGTTQLLAGTIPAVYSGQSWSCDATLQDNHYTFTVISSPDTSKGITKEDVFFNGSGHQVRWELVVDTSYITGVVAQNTKVVVTATDYSSTTGRTGNSNYQVDILPYITGITSRLDEPRSANGHYQLADDETSVMLQGYNLSQGNGPVDISSIMSSQASGQYDYTIPGTTITTINNINNNLAHGEFDITTPGLSRAKKAANMYNYQATSTNASLTDDVIFDMWQFNSRAAKTNSGYGFVQKPIMKYNPINGNLGFAFSNGADKFSMANGTSTSYTLWEMNYASYVANAFTIDQLGRSHGISVGIDTAPNSGKAGRMNYFYSGWGQSITNNENGNFYWRNNLHIDTIGLPDPLNYNNSPSSNPSVQYGGYDWSKSVIMEERFKGTTIVAANHGTENYPTVYIAYYDNICNRIVFRYGTITGGQTNSSNSNYPNDVKTYDQLITTNETKVSFALQDGQYSLIAGNDAQGNHLTPYEPGEYLCLTVIPGTTRDDDVVCIVWYDAMNKNLMYSYKKAPCNSNFASTTTGDGYWSTAKVLKENCGEYCKIAADGNGGIHIVAYDRKEKGIAYIYLPTYDASYTESDNLFFIDTFNGPFDEINIDVAVDNVGTGGKAFPTISYYANGTPKLATYSAGISSMPEKSIEDDSFTGNWDVCFVPTPSSLLKDHINVAIPKDGTGKLGHKESESLFNGTAGTNDGTVSGNTTNNPILAYAIRDGAVGYMEIAQRK